MIMWNRKELKEKGKAAVKRNYWKSVLVSAVFEGIIGGVCFYGRWRQITASTRHRSARD